MLTISSVVLLTLLYTDVANGFSAQSGTCMANQAAASLMGPQVTFGNPNDYIIVTDSDSGTYNPSRTYTVSLVNNVDTSGYRGLLLYATGDGGSEDRVGAFGTILNKTQILTCSGDPAATITHTQSGRGNLLFRATEQFTYQPPIDSSVRYIDFQAIVYTVGLNGRQTGNFIIPQPIRLNNEAFGDGGNVMNVGDDDDDVQVLNDPGLSGAFRLGEHDITYNIDTIAMTITVTAVGTNGQWLGLGYGNLRMENTYTLIFDNRGVSEWILGDNTPGNAITPDSTTNEQRTVQGTMASYTVTRPLRVSGINRGYDFQLLRGGTCLPETNMIWARGFGTYGTIVHQSRGNEMTIGSAECTGAASHVSLIFACISAIFVLFTLM